MRSFISILLLSASFSTAFSQSDVIKILTRDSLHLANITSEGYVMSPKSTNVIYSIKGNIIFEGTSEEIEDILYTVKPKDFFSKKSSVVYLSSTKKKYVTVKKGFFYLGSSDFLGEEDLLAILQKKDNSYTNVYHGQTKKRIGIINSTDISDAEAFMAFQIFANYYQLEKIVRAKLDSIQKANPQSTQSSGGSSLSTIRSLWNTGPESEWVWDAERGILSLRWIQDPYFEWTFDGEVLKPKWAHDVYEEYVWDGEVLKPLWRGGSNDEYIFDGRTIKPYWSSDVNREYIIEENIVRPLFGARQTEWTLRGRLPVPVIMLVIYGLAYR